jgi:hypothetical protein
MLLTKEIVAMVFTRWSSTGQRKVGQDFLSGATCSGEMILVWLLGNWVHQSSPCIHIEQADKTEDKASDEEKPAKKI